MRRSKKELLERREKNALKLAVNLTAQLHGKKNSVKKFLDVMLIFHDEDKEGGIQISSRGFTADCSDSPCIHQCAEKIVAFLIARGLIRGTMVDASFLEPKPDLKVI
jgi:hypothetical protein